MSKKWMFTSQTEKGTVPNMKKKHRVFTSQNCWIRYEKTAKSNGPPCVCANIDWAVARDDSVSCGSIQPIPALGRGISPIKMVELVEQWD
jgi:hypothetical protein